MVAADEISMPQPDVAVAVPGDYSAAHPTSGLLVVEIAKSSFLLDTKVKPPIYAAMSVPDYWVVDVERSVVIVFRHPQSGGYGKRTTHRAPERLQPVAVSVPPLDLGTLFG